MEEKAFFTAKEREQLFALYKRLLQLSGDTLQKGDCHKLKIHLIKAVAEGNLPRNCFGMNPIIKDMQTAVIVAEEIGMKRASILGIMLHESVKNHLCTLASVQQEYGEDVAGIIRGLVKINELYSKSPTIESENFRNLLLSFAEDMRVILIIIADRVNLMRQIKETPNIEARTQVANEAAYLYAPLAHKLGLYKLKSELEDLSLKYTEHDVYYHIKDKLNETKASRDKYIAAFIEPIQHKLEEAGLKFHMKGRTKSIHSIYQKMKKQKCPFEGVYDLFAIRIILDSPVDKEKQECWQVYSIVTDMYMPNPKRLRKQLPAPLCLHLHAVIPVISHPTGNPQRTGNITGPIAKSNSLHSPRKPIMLPYQILSHLRTLPILNIMLFPDSPAFLILLSNLLTCLRILQKRSVLLSLKIKYTQQQPSLTATVPAT